MRLQKVITPEIILGTRGSEEAIRAYKLFLGDIDSLGTTSEEEALARGGGGLVCGSAVRALDDITQAHLALCWRYKKSGGKAFHVGKDFAQAISKVNRDIPLDRLPERFFAYFSFPEGTFIEDYRGFNQNVKGGFIFIGPWWETTANAEMSKLGKVKQVAQIVYELTAPEKLEEKGIFGVASLLTPLNEADILKKLEDQPLIPGADSTPNSDVFRAFINLALYVHSTDPDLLPTRSVEQLSISERKRFYAKHGVANHCTIPVTFVSWNYNKPKVYSVDSTLVSGHFRWQRHGKGFSEVKLIWIDDHERKFKGGVIHGDDQETA